jgi:hypothetical protein
MTLKTAGSAFLLIAMTAAGCAGTGDAVRDATDATDVPADVADVDPDPGALDLPVDPRADGPGNEGPTDPGRSDEAPDGSADTPDEIPPPLEPGTEIAIEPSDGYRARQAEYLAHCRDNAGPGQGGYQGIVCRVATGESTFNEDALDAALDRMDTRTDTADFRMAAVVRALYLDRETQALPAEVRERIETTLLGFRYWLDEPGDDGMCYWTENHQILFHSGELLVGQLFPETTFGNSGMTGADHVAHAIPRLHRWLDLRGRLGFSEWHSNVYFNEDIPALVNLADFAEDPVIREKAAMVLDVLALDLLANMYRGTFATVHGRTYESKFLDRLNDSTRTAAYIMLGLASPDGDTDFSGSFLATSPRYVVPPILEELADAVADRYVHRQRDSFDIAEGPRWGVGYTGTDDVVIWAGLAAIAAPEVIEGTMEMLEEHGLWNGFLFGDLPEEVLTVLKDNRGTGTLPVLAENLWPMSRGMSMQAMSTYTYRTPHFQLSGAQDYPKCHWGTQTQMWLATLDRDAYVFTTYPAQLGLAGPDLTFAGDWIGGYSPRATFVRDVGILQYRPPDNEAVSDFLSADITHAFFPKARFDEVVEDGPWLFGRKGDGYLALASQNPAYWSEDNDFEWVAPGNENVWIIQMGSTEEFADFDAFIDAVTAANLSFETSVRYASPTAGVLEVGWEGPLTVDGVEADLGPYERFDSEHIRQPLGSPQATVSLDDRVLVLDFHRATRRLFQVAGD